MKTILHIVGNRPQFIKLAVLYKELAEAGIAQQIIHTGQHSGKEMSEIFFSELSIPYPDHFLELQNNGNADKFIAEAAVSLQQYFSSQKKCIAFVYGDTNTTLAGAIAAKRTGLDLYHFEAGVRTGEISMPEEINRVLTDRLADRNYCCTDLNYSTLQSEGYGNAIDSQPLLTGDLMYDAFLQLPYSEKNEVSFKNYVAATIHRVGNILTDVNLASIIDGLNKINKEIPVVMPLHPHTKKRIEEFGLAPEFHCFSPLSYAAMKTLLTNADYVITDSGGVARESFFCKKRSLVMMENPFWPEIMHAGCGINISAADDLYSSFYKLPSLVPDFDKPIFGNGQAAKLIKQDILSA